MPALEFANVTKSYGPQRAVACVTLSIEQGEVFSILGPSGCGKTTLLRMAAGFEAPNSGSILLDGEDITGLPPEKRPINTVFQNYALFPHLTARQNIAFGPKTAGTDATETNRRVEEILKLVKLTDHADKSPSQLSGGQRQRVAIARALINKPRVLLLDEPLAALDMKLRQHMLTELRALQREVGCTFVFVTHDQTEAIAISDRIAVMNHGALEQVGTPTEIYESPETAFVASFIGQTNFMPATVLWCQGPEGRATSADDMLCRLHSEALGEVTARTAEPLAEGTAVQISVRPENWFISDVSPEKSRGMNSVHGRVIDVSYLGAQSALRVLVNGAEILLQRPNRQDAPPTSLAPGSEAWISFHHLDAVVLPAPP